MPNVSTAQLKDNLDSFTARIEAAIKDLTTNHASTSTALTQKMDNIITRLDNYEVRIKNLEVSVQHNENRIGDLTVQIENGEQLTSQKFVALTVRVAELKEKVKKDCTLA